MNNLQSRNQELLFSKDYFCSKEHFQYLKGIAILAVIIGHIGNYSGKTWFTPLGGIGVAIFLFCSGYGLMTSYRNKGLSLFWKNKLIAIYLPFALVEIITAVILRRGLSDVVLELLFLKRLHPFGWYMQYLIACYLLFWLGVKYISNQKIRIGIWGILAIASFFLFGNLQGEQAISFLSGILFAKYRSEKGSSACKNEMNNLEADYNMNRLPALWSERFGGGGVLRKMLYNRLFISVSSSNSACY